jgi:hypothetical protein
MSPSNSHRNPIPPLEGHESSMADSTERIARMPWEIARECRIDDELAQSFPASDPPSWVHG